VGGGVEIDLVVMLFGLEVLGLLLLEVILSVGLKRFIEKIFG